MSLWQSYKSLTRRQRLVAGLFGIASSLFGMWFTESKLNVADRERQPLGLAVREATSADEPRTIVRLTPQRKAGESEPVK